MKHIACLSLLVFPLATMLACGSSSSGNGAPGSFDGGAIDSGSASDSGNVSANDAGDGGLPVVACTTAPQFSWARGAGSAGNDLANGIALDAAGNVYITGYFVGDANFGGIAVTSADKTGSSIFVAKLDTNGQFVWAQSYGGAGDAGIGIGVDASGDVFVTGAFTGTVNFGGHSVSATGSGSNVFLVRMTPASGDVVWAYAMAGAAYPRAITVDSSGSSYLAGGYFGNVTLSPTVMLTGDGVTKPDAYIAKIDSTGTPVFAWQATGPGDEGGEFVGVGLDSTGSVYAAGNIFGSLTFPGPTTLDGDSTFVAKYDTGGADVLFAKQATSTGALAFNSFALGADGTSYITGQFSGTASFDGLNVAATSTEKDAVTVSYDPTGKGAWAKHGGGAGFDSAGTAIAFDGANAVYVTGTAAGAAAFDNQALPANAGGFFVVKYDLNGVALWSTSNTGGLANSSFGAGIVAKPSAGGTYALGAYGGTTSFGTFSLTATGMEDTVVTRICN